jgi:hypothetical protein
MKYIITESQYNLLTESLSPEVRRRLPFENLMNDMEYGILDSMNPCEYEGIGDYIEDACDAMVGIMDVYFMDEFEYVLQPKEKDSLYYFFVDYFRKFLINYRESNCK